jgi:hypothetical protein
MAMVSELTPTARNVGGIPGVDHEFDAAECTLDRAGVFVLTIQKPERELQVVHCEATYIALKRPKLSKQVHHRVPTTHT